MTDIKDTLEERGNSHGNFTENSTVSQCLKKALKMGPNYGNLPDYQAEALDQICHKIGCIMAGDNNFHDHWHDIQGYAKLPADILKDEAESSTNIYRVQDKPENPFQPPFITEELKEAFRRAGKHLSAIANGEGTQADEDEDDDPLLRLKCHGDGRQLVLSELNECPRCGSHPDLYENETNNHGDPYQMVCSACHFNSGPARTQVEAGIKWNRAW